MANKIMAADGVVIAQTSGIKTITGIIIDYAGATEGDVVALRDGGASGTVVFRAIIPTDNGTMAIQLPEDGIVIGSGLYYTELATAAGKIHTNIIWK